MMIDTKHFGKIEIMEERVIHFERGLPGFENVKKFVMLNDEDKASPFNWLQCVDQPNLAFVVVNPFEIKKDYDVDIDDDVLNSIDAKKQEDLAIFSIVVIPDEMSEVSMNLKAPVLINTKAKKGVQIVLDTEEYSVRHYILEEIQKQEGAANVSAGEEKGAVHSHK